MINPTLEQWLRNNGYEHYVFVSYPNVAGAAARDCARAIAREIRRRFADFNTLSACERVFLDTDCIPDGSQWERRLVNAISRSVIMVAICSPIYYDSAHPWCGREYQAMMTLGKSRGAAALLPLIVRKFPDYPLPKAIEQFNFIDATGSAKDATYFRPTHKKFRQDLDRIEAHLLDAAKVLYARKAAASVSSFVFPNDSAFHNYNSQPQPAPLRKPR